MSLILAGVTLLIMGGLWFTKNIEDLWFSEFWFTYY